MIQTPRRIDAQEMGRAVQFDPQMQPPRHPRISASFVMMPYGEDGLLIDGAVEKQLFRGRGAKIVLPAVIELCDGHNSLQDIARALPSFPPEAVYNAVALLYSRGMLQEGPIPSDFERSVVSFIDRHIDFTRANENTEQVCVRLDCTTVAAYGDAEFAQALSEQIEASGMHMVRDATDVCAMAVGFWEGPEGLSHAREQAIQLWEKGIPLVLSILDGEKLSIVFLEPEETICIDCLLGQMRRLPRTTTDSPRGATRRAYLRRMAGIYTAMEIFFLRSLLAPTYLASNIVKSMELGTLRSESIPFARVPFCKTCDATETDREPVINYVSQYESFVQFPSRKYINPKDHQNHYKPSNISLTREYKHFPSSPRRPLKPREELPLLVEAVSAKDLDALALLLMYTNGVKETAERVKRWAPTGGNLGSPAVYFLNEGIASLDRAVYFYDPFEHELVQVAKLLPELRHTWMLPPPETNWGWLVFTGSYERVSKKYRDFAFKIICLDAGVALAQARTASDAAGIRLELCNYWEEQPLREGIQVRNWQEIVTMVVGIGRNGHERP